MSWEGRFKNLWVLEKALGRAQFWGEQERLAVARPPVCDPERRPVAVAAVPYFRALSWEEEWGCFPPPTLHTKDLWAKRWAAPKIVFHLL